MDQIRASPYEPGLYFVLPEPNTTLQSIGEQQWSVGTRYKLEKVLGYGSNSTVCLAHDTQTSEKVALKRIGNVLQSPESAKRVLREVCILRRLSHPNIIALKDCFVRPSATGECRLLNGKLVCMSVDLYIAMECGEGDLFHLKGQLSSQEVQNLLWQIVQSVNYLHSLHVWHRDVKSSNFLFKWENGERIVKLGDFGSARFADPDGYEIAEQPRPLVTTTNSSSSSSGLQHRAAGRKSRIEHKDSFEADIDALRPMDIYAQPGNVHNGGNVSTSTTCHHHHHHDHHGDQDNSNSSSSKTTITSSTSEGQTGAGAGYKSPLTCVVTTPCYRAPEVVMSRGGYTSAIDVWSIGCIFGELLQREAHVGSATTPNLQVAPLFAMMGKPLTPAPGESFDHPGNETTRRELAALFDVIGTPCWSDLESIQSPHWREYVKRMPGKASRLYRRLGAAGEAAVDLLRRMLEFEPHRRCSCEEALAHEYFESYVIDEDDEGLIDGGGDAVMATVAATAAEAAADAVVIETKEEEEVKLPKPTTSPKRKHALARYCEEPNPGRALAMLEQELSKISHQLELSVACPNNDNNSASTAVSVANAGCQRLRELLEAECTAIAASSNSISCYNTIATTTTTSTAIGGGQSGRRKKAKGVDAITGLLGGTGLQLDTSADRVVRQIRTEEGERDLGRERLANVADTWRVGKELDPSKYLSLGRHGEWTDHGLGRKDKQSQPWGVSLGDANMDPKMAEVIRKQQAR